MSEARKHLETEVKAAKYLKESTIAVSVDHLDTLLKASPPSGGEVVKLERFGIEWQGPESPICVTRPDGYWTPWHIADAALQAALEAK